MDNVIDRSIEVLLSNRENDKTFEDTFLLVGESKKIPVMLSNAVGLLWDLLPLRDMGLIITAVYLAGKQAGAVEVMEQFAIAGITEEGEN